MYEFKGKERIEDTRTYCIWDLHKLRGVDECRVGGWEGVSCADVGPLGTRI
jgi:hypothetical protein